ncbi:hypothetical protein F4604DRAFT_1711215 [Suillus subluteus]|nr:hypothetical protein F4604DRAFT_1711215 [Suillus subluteus]
MLDTHAYISLSLSLHGKLSRTFAITDTNNHDFYPSSVGAPANPDPYSVCSTEPLLLGGICITILESPDTTSLANMESRQCARRPADARTYLVCKTCTIMSLSRRKITLNSQSLLPAIRSFLLHKPRHKSTTHESGSMAFAADCNDFECIQEDASPKKASYSFLLELVRHLLTTFKFLQCIDPWKFILTRPSHCAETSFFM